MVRMTSKLRRIWMWRLGGAGSILEIEPVPIKTRLVSSLRLMSVEDALRSDWKRVGGDLRRAMLSVEGTLTEHDRQRLESARNESRGQLSLFGDRPGD